MKSIVAKHKNGEHIGIYSVCSAHPLVIEATLRYELNTDNKVLIEATSNQVNQFGGYTGMKPADFYKFVNEIAKQVGFDQDRIILGGDHLGPNCWQKEPAAEAMEKSKVLIRDYVKAGFTKIHLDASMSCSDDPVPLDPVVVAQRAAILCEVAEQAASDELKGRLTYVIGTEVPVPGGEKEAINSVHVTTVKDAENTVTTHVEAFKARGIEQALSRVVGIVVQPGVEFDHSSVIHYKPEEAKDLSTYIESTDFVYEAHSTDYQTKEAFRELVRDHYAILKVGPAVTFALREAVFALADIEEELVASEAKSHIKDVIHEVLLDDQTYWKNYYSETHSKAMVDLNYSLSDRVRYYWTNPRITRAMDSLITNLETLEIPLGMLSQYLPEQYKKVVASELDSNPKSLMMSKIQGVLDDYSYGCN
ncbi:tagatose-bisphosphate aldolase subunit GatZ [Vibrio sp. VB16]|uniref:tagatose-bisphosphate aldolase subunit GatZ n=1 Tax=Vibrio sp. VB16 TaxID=2785746 RepID=UPI00189DF672|nr:tagatose-bisphosphate aldolase subunit GatZ [Vibrio sp. VB16]UGA57044.1 tagatose-bisphosphate aldolase subunit GatZ [Vibrio sp. VB16]